ncbi:glycosyltransferase family 9 protein [Uliginosibacterium sediminicola]|uniref:Glycosyltransferase family 9 protein n=1 Tax=Uliginosibacterium sediminicola TaxID=2024550 RepID=A0ABU9YYV3_9RHOO
MSRLPSRLLQLPMLALGSITRLLGPRGYPPNPRRILLAHHLLLGDTLMLAALLAKLRQQHPQAEIVMSCPTAIVPLFAAQPWGVRALPYDPRKAATLKALWRERSFDLALVAGDSRFSALARALGARHIVALAGDTPNYKNWFVDEQRAWPEQPTPLPEIFASLARGADAAGYTPADWPLAESKSFSLPAKPYAVLHLGASSALKQWPAERWTALAAALSAQGITPVWSAGKHETALVVAVDPQARYTSYAGMLDLLQLAQLLAGARLLVSPDTGVAHLGRITATPSVILFGPGSAMLCADSAFFSASPVRALSAAIACRDQKILFRRQISWVERCGRSRGDGATQCARARCMEALSLQSVLDACQSLLKAS